MASLTGPLALESLTAAEVRTLVPPALPQSCRAFADALAADSGPALDGAALAELTSAKRVRQCAALSSVKLAQDRVAAPLFAKEIRVLCAKGVPSAEASQDEAPAEGWSSTTGSIEDPPLWETMCEVKISSEGL